MDSILLTLLLVSVPVANLNKPIHPCAAPQYEQRDADHNKSDQVGSDIYNWHDSSYRYLRHKGMCKYREKERVLDGLNPFDRIIV